MFNYSEELLSNDKIVCPMNRDGYGNFSVHHLIIKILWRFIVKSFKIPAVAVSLVMVTSLVALNLMAEQKKPMGPPPEIQACKDKKVGDSCSFKTRDGATKNDSCKSITTPKGQELSCGDMPKPPKGGEAPKDGDKK